MSVCRFINGFKSAGKIIKLDFFFFEIFLDLILWPSVHLFIFGARLRNDKGFYIKFGKHISPLKYIRGDRKGILCIFFLPKKSIHLKVSFFHITIFFCDFSLLAFIWFLPVVFMYNHL